MDVRSTILGLFPQARITSGYRDPNSKLGRANPRSYHNVGRAFDVAPIPGVGFNDYVSKLKGAGVNIVEALDEQKHPLPHTTGPNWHIAYGDAKPMLQPRRPNFGAMSQMAGGFDPLAPKPADPIMAALQAPAPQPNFGAMSQPVAGFDPLAPKAGKPKFNLAALAGILGDALAAYGGQRGVFAPIMAQQRQDESEDNRFRERLSADLQSKREAALEAARKPYRFQNNSGDVVEVDPSTGAQRVLYMDPVGKTEYSRITDPTTGEISITPMGQGSRPTNAHIQALLANPDKAAEFDAKFGRGAAQYYLGGR